MECVPLTYSRFQQNPALSCNAQETSASLTSLIFICRHQTLATVTITAGPSPSADGFHPAGAVICVKRGLQHIFIYSGHPNGPAVSTASLNAQHDASDDRDCRQVTTKPAFTLSCAGDCLHAGSALALAHLNAWSWTALQFNSSKTSKTGGRMPMARLSS
jgi:hypothetical protein